MNKDVLTQLEVLVALRMTSPQDRDAIERWVEVHADADEARTVLGSLPGLEIGEAWIWSPGWLGWLKRVRIAARETFDSSATPKVGERVAPPSGAAPVDLDALRVRMAETLEKARTEDPRVLRARIAELERALAGAPKVTAIEVPVLDDEQAKLLGRFVDGLRGVVADVSAAATRVATALEAARRPPSAASVARAPTAERGAPQESGAPSEGVPTAPQRRLLTALAQYPQGRSRVQLALLTAYAHNGGAFANYVSSMRSKGWIEGGQDRLVITDVGKRVLGDFEPLPTGRALLEHWLSRLGRAERTILEKLAAAYPRALSKEELAAATGYAAAGGGFANALSRLRTLGLLEGRERMSASASLFDTRAAT